MSTHVYTCTHMCSSIPANVVVGLDNLWELISIDTTNKYNSIVTDPRIHEFPVLRELRSFSITSFYVCVYVCVLYAFAIHIRLHLDRRYAKRRCRKCLKIWARYYHVIIRRNWANSRVTKIKYRTVLSADNNVKQNRHKVLWSNRRISTRIVRQIMKRLRNRSQFIRDVFINKKPPDLILLNLSLYWTHVVVFLFVEL